MSSKHVIDWRKNTKRRIVASFGGKCGICGYNKCDSSLALHHLDPTEKEFSLGAIRANPKSWLKIVVELRKCALVCHNCHSEIHSGITTIPESIVRFNESYVTYEELQTDVHNCPICNKLTPNRKTTCSVKCSTVYSRTNRIKWETIDLVNLLNTYTLTEIAIQLKCTTSAIIKRMRKLNIDHPTCNTQSIIFNNINLEKELESKSYKDLCIEYGLTKERIQKYVKYNEIDIDTIIKNRITHIKPLPIKSVIVPIKFDKVADTTLHDIRKQDFESIYPTYGWSSKLGTTWNMSSQAASRYCHKHFNIGNEHNRISNEDIINGFSNKLSLKQIGNKFGLSGSSVSEYCKKYEIAIPKYVFKVDWDNIDLGEMLKTKSITDIANELGITYTPVRNKAKLLGLI